MDGARRLFVALMLGRELGEAVATEVEGALRGGEWRRYAAGDLHATLFFLGAWAEVGPLERELAVLAPRHGPFELRLGRAGAFPERGRERILWLGVDEAHAGGLARLAADVAGACVGLGARPEDRPWRAHVTVARSRERAGARAPERFHALDLGLEWKPTRLALVESLAGREPSSGERESYRVVADFALATR